MQVLDLYRDSIQRVDEDVFNVWGRIERGEDYGLLSDGERHKIARILRLTDQFCRSDKYVFVTHSLNLWFPAEFKMYIDAIGIPDPSNHMTPLAAKSMFPGQHRKSLHLHAGPLHKFGQKQDMSGAYLCSILGFLGVTDQETVFLEGDDPERVSVGNHEKARHRLLELARHF